MIESTTKRGASARDVTPVGVDVAKQVCQVHEVDAQGQVVVRKQLRRKEVVAYWSRPSGPVN